MRISSASAFLGPALLVSAAALPANNTLAPAAPLDKLTAHKHKIITPVELFSALANAGIQVINNVTSPVTNLLGAAGINLDLHPDSKSQLESSKVQTTSFKSDELVTTAAVCDRPRVRTEWDSYSNDDKHAYVNAINCLRGKPASGMFPPAGNRYEDLVRLHQSLTPNVHDNAKFLVWHRYFVWVFEDMLRTECGFDRNLPWWDEGRNTGRFASSSVFSGEFYGAIAIGGNCVTNGVRPPPTIPYH
jgi:tyrosinase